jgi:hypothetical protein
MVNFLHDGSEAIKTNITLGYSKSLLPVFTPVFIKLLKSLAVITGDKGYRGQGGIKAGETCQLSITPAGEVNVGYFSPFGSGTVFHSFNCSNPFIENVDFIFV